MIASTPTPPYYAVIFTSTRTGNDKGYSEVAEHMLTLAAEQDGFLGVESARQDLGITVSYWRDEASIRAWKENAEHAVAREKGRKFWYDTFKVRVAKVERDYGFERKP